MNKYYPPKIGGIEFHVQDLAESLVAAGLEVRVLVCNTRNESIRETIRGVEIIRCARLFEKSSTPVSLAFKDELEKNSEWADLVHFHFPYPFGEFEWLRSKPYKNKSVPYLITYHTDIVRQKTALSLYRPYLKRFLVGASAIIASSPQMVQYSDYLQPHKQKVRQINFGLKVKEIAFNREAINKARQIRKQFDDRPFVLFVGRLVYYKGVDVLAWSMRENDLDYVVIGQGPLRGEMESIAELIGAKKRLRVIDSVSYEELVSWLHAADVLVLPSVLESEAFGLVQIEAHAARTPTVSTKLKSGVVYANLDGITGLTVEVGDPHALGQALKRITSDRSLHDELAVQAQARALADFNLEQMVERTIELYAEILSTHQTK